MSLVSIIGPRPNLFDLQGLASTKRLEVRQPILTDADLEKIRSISEVGITLLKPGTLDTPFNPGFAPAGMGRGPDEPSAGPEGRGGEGTNITTLAAPMRG